jgi:hypothetical protein
MFGLKKDKKTRLTPNEVRPNSGAPAAPAALQWVIHHQSPLPWVNSVTLWPLGERE